MADKNKMIVNGNVVFFTKEENARLEEIKASFTEPPLNTEEKVERLAEYIEAIKPVVEKLTNLLP